MPFSLGRHNHLYKRKFELISSAMKNKDLLKTIIKSIAGIMVVASLIFIFFTVQKLEAKKEIASSYAELPSLELKRMDNSTVLLDKEYPDEKVILIVFSTECFFCKEEIDEILSNHLKFQNAKIVMASSQDCQSVLEFSKQYDALGATNIIFTYGESAETINWISQFNVPSIFIYNNAHNLVRHFKGKTSIAEILKYI